MVLGVGAVAIRIYPVVVDETLSKRLLFYWIYFLCKAGPFFFSSLLVSIGQAKFYFYYNKSLIAFYLFSYVTITFKSVTTVFDLISAAISVT